MKKNYLWTGCALAALTGLGFAGKPGVDIDKIIAEYEKKQQEIFKAGAAPSSAVDKLVDETMAQIDLKTLTAEDAAKVARYGLLTRPKYLPAALERMTALSTTNDTSGVIALSLTLELGAWKEDPPQENRLEIAQRLLSHPKLNDVLKGPFCAAPIDGLSTAKLTSAHRDEVFRMIDHFDPKNRGTAECMSGYWRMVARVESDGAKREPIRQRVVKLLQESAAIARKNGTREDWVVIWEETAKRLDGAAARGKLIGGKTPALDILWSSDAKLKSIDDLKGKVVILDFWATWCGPCVASFPHVKELQNHYKGYDVVIVGITSIQGNIIGLSKQGIIDTKGDSKREFALMAEYMKEKDITWPVVFTQQKVFNPDFGVGGIPHVAIIDPAGVVRYGGLHPADPLEKKTKLIDGLLKEFNLKTPGN